MANRFELLVPDVAGAFERGRAMSRQVERERIADQEMRAQVDRGNRFRELAGQAYGAQTPTERQQFMSQAAAADPQGAMALQQHLGSQEKTQQDLMMERMGITAGALVNAPEQMRPMLYKSMLPELRKFVPNAPDEYDPGMIPVAQQFLASRSGQPASVQAFRQMTQGMSPEDVERARRIELGLDARTSSASIGYKVLKGSDGRERLVAVDPRTPGAMMIDDGSGAFVSQTPGEKVAEERLAAADVDLQMKPQIAAATESAKVTGKKGAEAAENLPQVEANADQMLGLLDKLAKHPGLAGAVGVRAGMEYLPATNEADFVALLDQIGGKQFLQAFESLKGGGQITEIEGKKATDAIARLQSRRQSEKSYREAIADFVDVVESARLRAQQRARRAQLAQPPSSGQSQQVGSEITATGPNGQKIVLRDGQWVPLQ